MFVEKMIEKYWSKWKYLDRNNEQVYTKIITPDIFKKVNQFTQISISAL